ncbi:MAG: alpha-L-rhamnosidase [Acidobacteriia bacterium]|nr:alpha-L-rhamnosidase [Terriglobia bacterium]
MSNSHATAQLIEAIFWTLHRFERRKHVVGFVVVLFALQLQGFTLAHGRGDGSDHLDPTWDISSPTLESSLHAPLPEQYIWKSEISDAGRTEFLYFRKSFSLRQIPRVATLYAAGPNLIKVYINGHLLANGNRGSMERIRPFVLGINVSEWLRAGPNLIAVMVSQGDRLVLKIIPGTFQVMKPPILVTDATWKCTTLLHDGWEELRFNDLGWRQAESLGGIEQYSDFFQGNKDAGMYRWPGYDGISPFLARSVLKASDLPYGFPGMGKLLNVSASFAGGSSGLPQGLRPFPRKGPVKASQGKLQSINETTVILPARKSPLSEYPYLVLDFGRECVGRIRILSDTPALIHLEVQYGESIEEAFISPYLGANEIDVPAYGTAYGPKSAFRYALVRFLGGPPVLRFKAIDVDYIYYPVYQVGTFQSSDPLLNRIWDVGAYTAHLSMQDAIWDGPKRERVPQAGGLDVSGQVISTVFGDRILIGSTLKSLIAEAGNPVKNDVNGIPGYSALWVISEANYFRHSGDVAQLRSVRDSLQSLLEYMATQIDAEGRFTNPHQHWVFVDWSPDLDGDSPEARAVTLMQFAKAFSEGAWLLEQTGDVALSQGVKTHAETLIQNALRNLLNPATNTFGDRWQTNAMAIFAGLADSNQQAAIWENILSRPYRFTVSPHFGFYAISSMAATGRRKEALDWIRKYWGGMLRPETTTFWEGYDPRWPTENFHARLRSDRGEGYFVTLCHGWASGPTAWLTEQVLGIQPVAAGFREVTIRPDLCDLKWVRGSEPCPQGSIEVDYQHDNADFKATIKVPQGVVAQVSMPVDRGEGSIVIDGHAVSGLPSEDGTRLTVILSGAGVHELRSHFTLR